MGGEAIGTFQLVSNNRLVLGLGTGNPAHGDVGSRRPVSSSPEHRRLTDEELAVLPDLIAGKPATLATGVDATIAPGAPVPPMLWPATVYGRIGERRRTPMGGDDGVVAGRGADGLERINELADGKKLKATVVAAELDGDPLEQLAAYEAAGVEHIILPPTGDWHDDYDQPRH